MLRETCATCKYFGAWNLNVILRESGSCMFNAPVQAVDSRSWDIQMIDGFPRMDGGSWCGQWALVATHHELRSTMGTVWEDNNA